MKTINVIIKEQNLDLLRNTNLSTDEVVNMVYKGYKAPCVVFEDVDFIVAARTLDKYNLFANKSVNELLIILKDEKINQLHANYDASYNAYLAQYPSAEVATFATKQKEAEAYSIDNTVATPVIDGIISSSGDTKAVYVQSVLDKISYLAQLEGDMVATRDAIKACNTQAELDAIVV